MSLPGFCRTRFFVISRFLPKIISLCQAVQVAFISTRRRERYSPVSQILQLADLSSPRKEGLKLIFFLNLAKGRKTRTSSTIKHVNESRDRLDQYWHGTRLINHGLTPASAVYLPLNKIPARCHSVVHKTRLVSLDFFRMRRVVR